MGFLRSHPERSEMTGQASSRWGSFCLSGFCFVGHGCSAWRIRDATGGLDPEIVVRVVENANPGEGRHPRTGNPLSIGSGSPFIE
jgi:hypothetical protein